MDPETGWRCELALSVESAFDVAEAMGYPVVLECMKDQKLRSTLKIHDKAGLAGQCSWMQKYLATEGYVYVRKADRF
jgi:hypothetical protein